MNSKCSGEEGDLREIQELTPFTEEDLKGVGFRRGKMLGDASPLQSATPAPWEERKSTK